MEKGFSFSFCFVLLLSRVREQKRDDEKGNGAAIERGGGEGVQGNELDAIVSREDAQKQDDRTAPGPRRVAQEGQLLALGSLLSGPANERTKL